MSVAAPSVPDMSNFSPRIRATDDNDEDRNAWQAGFKPNISAGISMRCDQCAALVQQTPGSARRHLDWHDQLEERLTADETPDPRKGPPPFVL